MHEGEKASSQRNPVRNRSWQPKLRDLSGQVVSLLN